MSFLKALLVGSMLCVLLGIILILALVAAQVDPFLGAVVGVLCVASAAVLWQERTS